MLALLLWVRGNVGVEIWRMFISDTPKIEILHVQYNRLLSVWQLSSDAKLMTGNYKPGSRKSGTVNKNAVLVQLFFMSLKSCSNKGFDVEISSSNTPPRELYRIILSESNDKT